MLKNFILNYLDDLKGQNIICFDIHNKNRITDFMILCTGRSNHHVKSIAQSILKKIKSMKQKWNRVEGIEFGEWVSIDLGEIIIHIMKYETRKLYDLEKLWT
ncbi:unknown function family DUF143; homolog of plant Iojap protein [Candidatus Blochmanniella floridana]|uniref:Ribosomal silencing factor RsfS n=1 Tax=Blochmanniella floridana TaxID=203907 RepID=Q7VRA9_BLOFL|nr:unknown function family DUF143; homolog of plant Iojap protein [Candidatus Blochmannia floridanus]